MNTPSSMVSKPSMQTRCVLSIAVASALILTGCGDDNKSFYTQVAPPPAEFIKSFTANEMNALIASNSGTPQAECGVTIEKVTYNTVGAAGEATNATAALMVPTGNTENCSGERPVLLYAHGTTTDKNYDFTQVGNTNNSAVGESTLIATNFAAQGYIVVAPNYAGYDDSELDYHPYLVAEQQSADMIDALENARLVIDKQRLANNANYANVDDSDKLYISGYSQGGHVAMATARALEFDNQEVTAIAPLSGPYALAAFGDEIFKGNVNIGASRFAPLLGIGLQEKYGDIYNQPSDIFLDKYADVRLPSATSFADLVTMDKVPNNALFQKTPTNPVLVGLSKGSIFSFLGGYDDNNYLIKSDFRADYVTDAINNPDGTTIANGNNLPAANPQNNLRKALKDNDLRGYVPTMPTLLCGGNQDPTVYFDTNTGTMTQLLQAASANNPSATLNITVLDVDKDNEDTRPDKTTLTTIGHASMNPWNISDVLESVQGNFSNSVQKIRDDATAQGNNPLLEFYSNYHGVLVTAACTQATRAFFDQDFSQTDTVL